MSIEITEQKTVTIGGGSGGAGLNGALPEFGSYTFYVSGSTVYAHNNLTGVLDYSGADAAVVINSALAAIATVGGHLFFKNGIYPLASATQETGGYFATHAGYWYCIGIPSNVFTTASLVQFHFEGEARPAWMGESLTADIDTSGVIFLVTAAAVTAAGTGFLAAIWQRNDPVSFYTNELFFKNLCVRHVTNQRGNTGGIIAWAADSVLYDNVLADFNLAYGTIGTGASAPVKGAIGSFGLTTSVSGAGVPQKFLNTFVVGYDVGYDFASEHTEGDTVDAIYCNYAGVYGGTSTGLNTFGVFHPSVITKFLSQECLNDILLGPKCQTGSRLDLIGLDIELGGHDGDWPNRNACAMAETNAGATSGIITYSVVKFVTGLVNGGPLFTSGGGNFISFNSFTPSLVSGLTRVVFNEQSGLLGTNYNAGAAQTITTPVGFASSYRVSWSQSIVVAGTNSSTFPSLTLGWTDAGTIARTQTLVATSTVNTTAVTSSGSAIIYTNATAVTITSASYADGGGANQMKYVLSVQLERLS